MKKIIFVCHGNICRSPMAEFIMKDLVEKAGAAEEFSIESSATSSEETGNCVYPPAARELKRHGIESHGKYARRFNMNDYNNNDLIVVMEDYNLHNLMRIIGCDCEHKVWKLLDFIEETPTRTSGRDISDPWYHNDFTKTYQEIYDGCKGLLSFLGY